MPYGAVCKGGTAISFRRYVALGDSGTEGVGDHPYPDGSERGWADRLAEIVAAENPHLRYANLAVRGRRIAEVHEQQLGPAVALEPDLVTVVAGVNDIIRSRFDLDASLLHMDEMLRDLRATGATVVTATYPDLSALIPAARLVRRRFQLFNAGLRAVAATRGALVVDATDFPVLADPRLWCADRLHLSPEGHHGLALATARTLGYDVSEGVPEVLPTAPVGSRRRRLQEELQWARTFLVPWIHRRVTGRSSGDGRFAKRPELGPLSRGDT